MLHVERFGHTFGDPCTDAAAGFAVTVTVRFVVAVPEGET
jgi:hypothetical protein